MKATKSVEETCQLIEDYKLMSSNDCATMRRRWFRPDRKEVADADEFRKWLVRNRYLTEFVAKVLASGKSVQLVLNQYRLQDQMISGPMAGAYLALDALDRPVAIEVLSSSSTKDPSVLTRFQQVALKAMEVRHPNVARILDAGEAHGLHYLVKEHSEGPTLDESSCSGGASCPTFRRRGSWRWPWLGLRPCTPTGSRQGTSPRTVCCWPPRARGPRAIAPSRFCTRA